MRLFTAIPTPDDIKENLRALIHRLRPSSPPPPAMRWSPVENLHITTQFMGEWPGDRLAEMQRALAAMPPPGPIDITVRGLGWFPNERRPRVLWAGIEAAETLHSLALSTRWAVAALGVPVEERIYSPHLTLARLREAASLGSLRAAIQSLPAGCGFDFGSFRASEFFLYLSAGGKYTRLAAFPLS